MGIKPLTIAPTNKATDLVKYGSGPHWYSSPDAEAEIKFAATGPASERATPPKTLIEVFAAAVKKKPMKIAMRTENLPALKKGEKAPGPIALNEWKSWTWRHYYEDCRRAAKAMISLGLKQHDAVNIFGYNSPEWFIGQMSAIIAGAKAAGIYPSDTADQVQFKSCHSNGAVAFVEDESCLKKFSGEVNNLPYLKVIVCWACSPGDDLKRKDGSTVKTMSFNDLLAMGQKLEEVELEERIAKIKPGHCCALIYTSGTTGKPKAVMISHDNLIFEAATVIPTSGLGGEKEEERLMSYLPLSHIAGMMLDIICPIVMTATMVGWGSSNFARSYDLKIGTIGDRLKTIRPTLFLGVPRVWEKISEKLKAVGAQTKGLKKKLATTAKRKALVASQNQLLGGSGKTPFMYKPYAALLKKIKQALGLDQCKFAFAGAAPMTKDCLEYFGALGINVNEAYGMSESTGATTWSTDRAHEWGTVGFELPGCEVKILKKGADGKLTEVEKADFSSANIPEKAQGEVCFRGRHIMMGYMANASLGAEHVALINKKNAEAIDSQGWLHSEDKGAKSAAGMVKITGRYKELIIGAGGENIAPVPIEDNMKRLCPEISNIMMIGDKRKFNICLIALKCVGATGEMAGTDELDGPAAKWGKTITDACNNKDFIAYLTKNLTDTNNNGDVCPSNASKVQKFTILPIDFSVATDDLTATLKLKRSVVYDKYLKDIDRIYESKDTFVSIVGGKSSRKSSKAARKSSKSARKSSKAPAAASPEDAVAIPQI